MRGRVHKSVQLGVANGKFGIAQPQGVGSFIDQYFEFPSSFIVSDVGPNDRADNQKPCAENARQVKPGTLPKRFANLKDKVGRVAPTEGSVFFGPDFNIILTGIQV